MSFLWQSRSRHYKEHSWIGSGSPPLVFFTFKVCFWGHKPPRQGRHPWIILPLGGKGFFLPWASLLCSAAAWLRWPLVKHWSQATCARCAGAEGSRFRFCQFSTRAELWRRFLAAPLSPFLFLLHLVISLSQAEMRITSLCIQIT